MLDKKIDGGEKDKIIRLLIVDDSALMRKLLVQTFSRESDFEICTARDGVEALEVLHKFQPDVVSLDIHMPGKDGLECLRRIMIERPTRVVMFSSLTEKGAATTIEAMSLGAVDYMAKPEGVGTLTLEKISADLVAKIRVACDARIRRSVGLLQRLREQNTRMEPAKPPRLVSLNASAAGVVLIGVSTGGPRTLDEILPNLPENFPWPVVVAQHMPPTFTNAMARRMDTLCPLRVMEVTRPTTLEAGHIYICQGDHDAVLSSRGRNVTLMPAPASPAHLWHPSVDVLVKSAATVLTPAQTIGVLLTGMGYDGAAEMAALRHRGGHTIAESEESAVVFGMPFELIEKGGAEVVLPAEQIAAQLIKWLQ